jgi:putative FmdB family regulatory protein
MPTYEYRCKDCGRHLEVVQSFTDDPLTVCPNCKGILKKVFSPVGIVLKGSGFYRTDSRPASTKKTADTTSGTSDSSSGASSDKKGAEKKGSDSKGSEGKSETKKKTAGEKSA